MSFFLFKVHGDAATGHPPSHAWFPALTSSSVQFRFLPVIWCICCLILLILLSSIPLYGHTTVCSILQLKSGYNVTVPVRGCYRAAVNVCGHLLWANPLISLTSNAGLHDKDASLTWFEIAGQFST